MALKVNLCDFGALQGVQQAKISMTGRQIVEVTRQGQGAGWRGAAKGALATSLVAATLLLAACQSGNVQSQQGGTSAGAAAQISGIAMPEGYSLDLNRTLILGDGDRWTGRLSYSINAAADAMFDFVRREMLNYGWQEVAVVRAETSVLTFSSAGSGRVATIQIDRRTIGGSRVEMMVVPAGAGAASAPVAAPIAPARR